MEPVQAGITVSITAYKTVTMQRGKVSGAAGIGAQTR